MAEFITIINRPLEVPTSKRTKKHLELNAQITLDELRRRLDKVESGLAEQGFTIFRVSADAVESSDNICEGSAVLTVEGSRNETEAEVEARVKRQEAYNRVQQRNLDERLAQVKRRKELDRLTAHLTLEQLKAIRRVEDLTGTQPSTTFG